MKKTLLIAALAAASLASMPASAGFQAGILNGMAMGQALNPQPVQVEIIQPAPAPRTAAQAAAAADQGGSWDNPAPMRRVVTVMPSADQTSVNCRYSDGSVVTVNSSTACPK